MQNRKITTFDRHSSIDIIRSMMHSASSEGSHLIRPKCMQSHQNGLRRNRCDASDAIKNDVNDKTFFLRQRFEFRNKPLNLKIVVHFNWTSFMRNSLAAPKLNKRTTKMRMSNKKKKKHQLISLKRFANGFFRTLHKHVRTLSSLFTQYVNKSRLAGHGIWRWSTPQRRHSQFLPSCAFIQSCKQ